MGKRLLSGGILFVILMILCGYQLYGYCCEGDKENAFFQGILMVLCIAIMGRAVVTAYKKEKDK